MSINATAFLQVAIFEALAAVEKHLGPLEGDVVRDLRSAMARAVGEAASRMAASRDEARRAYELYWEPKR